MDIVWIIGLGWGLIGLVAGLMTGKGYMLRLCVILGPLAFFLVPRNDHS